MFARYFVEEAEADAASAAQRQAERQLIESGQELFMPKTVALELELLLQALAGVRSGLDFADALHHASTTCSRLWWCQQPGKPQASGAEWGS